MNKDQEYYWFPYLMGFSDEKSRHITNQNELCKKINHRLPFSCK